MLGKSRAVMEDDGCKPVQHLHLVKKKITSSKVFLCDCDLKQVKGVVSLKKTVLFLLLKSTLVKLGQGRGVTT